MFVNFRLAMQPFWVRFLVLTTLYAVLFGALSYFEPRTSTESPGAIVIPALIFGVTLGGVLAYQGEAMRKRVVEAVPAAERAPAFAAFTSGAVPSDPAQRYAAARLAVAYLGNKTDDELKRRERSGWIVSAILVAVMIAVAVGQSSTYATVYFLALALIVAIALPFSVLRGRRLRQNLAQLRAGLPFG